MKEVFILKTLQISLAPIPQEGSFQAMFAGTEHTKKQKELNTCERKGQNAAKIAFFQIHASNFLGQ